MTGREIATATPRGALRRPAGPTRSLDISGLMDTGLVTLSIAASLRSEDQSGDHDDGLAERAAALVTTFSPTLVRATIFSASR
ncbi:hypothetical protein ACGFMK_20415 [Amycolatopsis sp. NPDC049252]|uniref:hypothetical protein n=1 Tax=Amycolatopsis sp. NPDC049252 TaxID=3363933 RepID=UPI0037196011